MPKNLYPLEACILTGGKNRRMGGEKKLFLEFQGKPFYEILKNAVKEAGIPSLLLSVEAREAYASLPFPLIEDKWKDLGPIGGIASVLASTHMPAVFFLSCDTPLVSADTILQIIKESLSHPDSIVIAKTAERIHPLCGIYPVSALPIIEEQIAHGRYRMMSLLDLVDTIYVPIKEERELVNVNTPEDYQALESQSL